MATNLVKFYSGSATNFTPGSADANGIYFLTDKKQIYKGSVKYADLTEQEALAEQLSKIEDGAEVNVIESVTVNGSQLTITDKNVTITIASGSVNGTISVNGTDVAVTGLKSAAYEEASAFEEAGAAATVKGEVVNTITGDAAIGVTGTTTAKTLELKLSAEEGNVLEKKTDGLFATVPAAVVYDIKKLETATAGMAASYQLTKDGVVTGAVIDIPKDMVVQSGSVKEVTTADQPVTGYQVGDKYIDLVLANAIDSHIYVLVSDLVDNYTPGNGISVNNREISIVIATSDANGLSVSADGLKLGLASTTASGAMSAADKTKLDGVKTGANKTEASETNGNIKIDGVETTVYTHPTTTAVAAAFVKIGKDDKGHVVIGDTIKKEDITALGIASTDVATTTTDGLMSAADKGKLDEAYGALTWGTF